MKTSLDLPDSLLKKAEDVAQSKGVPLADFVAEAIQYRLSNLRIETTKPWMKHFGSLRHLHSESQHIGEMIAEEFENVDEKLF